MTGRLSRSVLLAAGALLSGAAAPHRPAAAQDRPLAADFEEVYRIGGTNAPEWAQFGETTRLGFDAAGNLLILDREAAQVAIVGPRGALVRTVGRSGEGPGEFRMAGDIAVWRNGRFAVIDFGHNAFQVFSHEGELLRFVKMSVAEGPMALVTGMGSMPARTRAEPLGDALIAQGAPSMLGRMAGLMAQIRGGAEEPQDDGRVDERGLERLALDGDVVVASRILEGWRIPEGESPEPLAERGLADPSSVVVGMMSQVAFYEPQLLWDVLPDGTIAYSDSSAYAVKLADAEGSVTAVLRRPRAPEPVTRAIRSATIENSLRELDAQMNTAGSQTEAARAMMQLMPGVLESMRQQIERQEFFAEVPVVRAVRAAWDGALWIQRRGEDPWDDEGPIDVFGADREYLGTYAPDAPRMPDAFGPEGLAAFREIGELDVPVIVVRRLPVEVR